MVSLKILWAVPAQKGVDLQLQIICNSGSRSGWLVGTKLPSLYHQERDPVPIAQEAEWALAAGLDGTENRTLTGFDPRTLKHGASRHTDWDIQVAITSVTTIRLHVGQ
jgi:hypothetical protein